MENSNLLGELFTAISHRQVVELHYHKFSSPHTELTVNIHPYLLKEYNRRWFLFAAAESDRKLLCFSLDRIDNAVPLPSHKYIDYDGEISEVFDDTIGVTINEESPVYNIVFWVSDISKDYVATKPIHDSQKNISGSEEEKLREMYTTLSGGSFFSIDCKENYELIRELTSFGKELIVLSPVIMREKIEKRISEMMEQYKSLEMRT